MSALDRLTAALSDRYRIERELGAGGMATVYLAEDLKHRRRVALKVLKPELAAVLGAERFVQEITTTAALQHPHLLPLFDSGEADGFLFYVMPFIDGETLRAKLDRETQLGVDEAVKIASDVADALHYAHTQGVVHRDIKPENILLANGRPMVADFGIALAVSAAAGGRMTETGLSLGTPHYMSPEQATAEKEISARSDVYSLASVLYEMLAGQPPHTGGSAQQIIMKIITEQPADVTSLRKSVPGNVAAAVAQALEKLPADRFVSAKAFAEALANPASSRSSQPLPVAAAAPAAARARALAPWVIAMVAVAVLAASVTRIQPPPSPIRVSMSVSELTAGGSAIISGGIDISRDGTVLVLVGSSAGERRLMVRRFDRFAGDVLPGTEGAVDPFFSPDGRWIGFFQGGRLRKMPSTGGPVETIRDGVTGSRGATWTEDGDVIYQPYTVGGLVRTRADGSGSGERLTTANDQTVEAGCAHRFPRALPGGRYVAFSAMPCGNPGEGHLMILDRTTGALRTLVQHASSARYLASGHLSYVTADGILTVVPFDLRHGEITGGPVASIAGIEVDGVGNAGTYAVADNGTLVYFRGGSNVMLRVDRTGVETVLADSLPGPIAPRFSPRGDRVAFETRARGRTGIGLFDVASRTTTPLVFNRIAHYPSWSADGTRVLFSGGGLQPGPAGLDLYEVAADGAAEPRVLVADPMALWEVIETPSRDRLIYRQSTRDAAEGRINRDVLYVLTGDSLRVPFAATPAQERAVALSPDGRWLAFASDESGQDEVYVRSFPDAARTWKVSTAGGGEPAWSADGNELFYRDGRDFISLRVEAQPTFRVVNRTALFADAYLTNVDHTNYDAHPSASWFIVIGNGRTEQVSVVFNWFTDLTARTLR